VRNAQSQIQQDDDFSTPGFYPSNGTPQFTVPVTPRYDALPDEQVEQGEYYSTTGMPPNVPTTLAIGVPVPATPFPGVGPVTVDPRTRERTWRYAQWLQLNNNLPVSPEKQQAYQDAALEIKKIGGREVRTFAPFQERTSALQVITSSQLAIFALLAIGWIAGLLFLHLVMFTITLGIVTLLYISGFITSGILATSSFRSSSGEKIDEEIIVALDQLGVEWPTYTILCPLYKESAIVPQFVEAMKSLDYPMDKLQVLFLTEENDNETRAALYGMYLPPGFTVLTVPKGSPQTKPRACNFGLLQAKGQFIVIFDAEDKPEPYQLKKAVLTFANHGSEVACVQAKLNYYNSRQNLLTRWFTAEYSTWFDIMLPGLQRTGFSLPLGGTSNHFRTEVLRALGGWDAFNVTEDCDLGLRISQYNLKTAVLDSTTYEEATSRVKTWLFQRSRWIKGYLQTYLVHMRHPLQALRKGHLRKFFSLQLIVGAWTVVLLINPFMWTLTLLYVLFQPVQLYSILFPGPILYMGAFCLIFGNFFYVYIHLIGCLRRKEYSLIKWVLLLPLYWVMMSISAYIAFYQLIVKPHYWEKTQHGNHLAPASRAQVHTVLPSLEREERAVVVSMPTTRLFAVTIGRVFKNTATSTRLETTTQRVTALRSTLSTQLGQRKIRRQMQLPRIRDRWLLAAVVIAVIASISSTIYTFAHHEILLYGDAYFHLRIARRIFDSATPGIGQLGTTWLPLPHLLMLPFIWNDYLWRTGLAGSFPAMVRYMIATVYLFLSGRRLTGNSPASFVGTLLFILNPNILYLQSTPLSELVCIVTLTMACYYFLAWIQDNSLKQLVFAAASTFLTTMARYDGWALFIALLVLVPTIGLIKRQRLRQIEGNFLVFFMLGGLGIALWLLYNAIISGNPLYFLHGPYSSKVQTLVLHNSQAPLYAYHNLWQSIRFYSINIMQTIGPILFLLALFALILFVLRKRFAPEVFGTLAFLAPFGFYILSLYTGDVALLVPGAVPANVPVQHQLFNARFGSEMVVPTSIFLVTLLDSWKLPKGWQFPLLKRFWSITGYIGCVAIILIQTMLVASGGIITLEDGLYGVSCEPTHPINIYLAQHYNGGRILEEIFNSPVDGSEATFDFKNIIWEGSYQIWSKALANPSAMVDWIIVNPESPTDLVAQHIHLKSSIFQSQFTLVLQEPSGLRLYHKNGLPPLPTRPIPSYLLTKHQLCDAGTNQQKGG